MTDDDKIGHMRRVVASQCPYAIELYDELVAAWRIQIETVTHAEQQKPLEGIDL